MKELAVLANAKINLTLDIAGRRPDGYHELRTVMQSVSLADRLIVARAPELSVVSDSTLVPEGGDNLAFRAAELFLRQAGLPGGAAVRLQKRIPVAAGLAGGSADAAAVLAALNRLTGTRWPAARLMELGARLGADVPFCLHGGTALCEGVGERVRPLRPLPPCWIVLGKAGFKPSTARLYEEFDRRGVCSPARTSAMVEALQKGSLPLAASRLGNAFLPVASSPHSVELRSLLLRAGALGAGMSGSGPAVFGLFADRRAAASAVKQLCAMGAEAAVCRPARTGLRFERPPKPKESDKPAFLPKSSGDCVPSE